MRVRARRWGGPTSPIHKLSFSTDRLADQSLQRYALCNLSTVSLNRTLWHVYKYFVLKFERKILLLSFRWRWKTSIGWSLFLWDELGNDSPDEPRFCSSFAEERSLSLTHTQLEIWSKVNRSFSSWRRKHLYGSGGEDPPIWYHCADVCFWGNSSPTLAISKVWIFCSSFHTEASSLIWWVSCVSINLNTQRFQSWYNAGKKHYISKKGRLKMPICHNLSSPHCWHCHLDRST